MALEEDKVTRALIARTAEEVVEAHLIEGRRRSIRGDVAANARQLFVGAHDHRHRIPAIDRLDAAFDLAVTRVGRLMLRGNRVDVGRARGHGQLDAGFLRVDLQALQQRLNALRSAHGEQIVEAVQPVAGFKCFDTEFFVLRWSHLSPLSHQSLALGLTDKGHGNMKVLICVTT